MEIQSLFILLLPLLRPFLHGTSFVAGQPASWPGFKLIVTICVSSLQTAVFLSFKLYLHFTENQLIVRLEQVLSVT